MKITSIAAFLCIFLSIACVAQKSPIKYGDIPLEDLKMTSYEKDSSASAVILADYGDLKFNLANQIVSLSFERHVRIKILTKDGLSWASAIIQLYRGGQHVSSLKASTYNLENNSAIESQMSKDGMFQEKFNRYIDLQKFTLPNVKVGSVIEYQYTIKAASIASLPNWQFQYSIPVRWSEFWTSLPESLVYEKYMQGYVVPNIYDQSQKQFGSRIEIVNHWVCKDVPAFKKEPFMANEVDYVSKINFALSSLNIGNIPLMEWTTSWDQLRENLLESEFFGKSITGSRFLKDKAVELTNGITDPEKKAEVIYNYVRQNFEWNGWDDCLADDLRKVVETKKGSVADINLLMASMLEKVDVPVDMVLMSTKDHGVIRKQHPMMSQFNYVICSLPLSNKTIFFDATDKFLPFGLLQQKNTGEGLLISKINRGWVTPKVTKSKTTVNVNLSYLNTGELKGNISFTKDGYDALNMRKEFYKQGKDLFIKNSIHHSWIADKVDVKNVEDLNKSGVLDLNFSTTNHHSVVGDYLYINPLLHSKFDSNPFKDDKRQYPIDFESAFENSYILTLTIPNDYIVDELPQPKLLSLPENTGKFTYSIGQSGNTLTIVCKTQINKSLFFQDEYPRLKEFYNQIIAKQSEQIVLKKKL